jgi:hypothetical protein
LAGCGERDAFRDVATESLIARRASTPVAWDESGRAT